MDSNLEPHRQCHRLWPEVPGVAALLLSVLCACQEPSERIEDTGVSQPDEGTWAACVETEDCDGGLACLGEAEVGFCSVSCSSGADPQWCLPPPEGVDLEVGCLAHTVPAPAGGYSTYCVLLCSDEDRCPAGMRCGLDQRGDTRFCQ